MRSWMTRSTRSGGETGLETGREAGWQDQQDVLEMDTYVFVSDHFLLNKNIFILF